jgi:hypothetical protein
MKYYKFYNEYHLGDNVFNLIFFNNIKDYLENNNIFINYYCESKYFEQLQEFIQSDKIILRKIENKPTKTMYI